MAGDGGASTYRLHGAVDVELALEIEQASGEAQVRAGFDDESEAQRVIRRPSVGDTRETDDDRKYAQRGDAQTKPKRVHAESFELESLDRAEVVTGHASAAFGDYFFAPGFE